jgi:predicted RNA-binding protein
MLMQHPLKMAKPEQQMIDDTQCDVNAASIKNDKTRAADVIDDTQSDVDAASVQKDKTRAADVIDDT